MEKPQKQEKVQKKGMSLSGIGIGAALLVVAGIFCILGQIYYIITDTKQIFMLLASAILLCAAIIVFVFLLVKTLGQKLMAQEATNDEMLQIMKATYMKTKKLSGQVNEELENVSQAVQSTVTGIRDDMAHVQQKQSEELYKRQMSIANVQIKRNQENMSAMLNSNDHVIDTIEEKINGITNMNVQDYSGAIEEVKSSVESLYKLCEEIAAMKAEPIITEAPVKAGSQPIPEPVSEAEPAQDPVPEAEPVAEPEPEISDDFFGVDIEPLPEEIVEEILEKREFTEPEVMPEPEPIPEVIPEPEPVAEPESEPEPVVLPEMDGDPNRQLTAEEIAALFNSL